MATAPNQLPDDVEALALTEAHARLSGAEAMYETVSALEWRCPRREPRTNFANLAKILTLDAGADGTGGTGDATELGPLAVWLEFPRGHLFHEVVARLPACAITL
jgi:hypothetical protein